MTDRTVSVKLALDAKAYVDGLADAAAKTREQTRTVEQQFETQRRAYDQVGAAATAVGVLALAGVTAAVLAYSEFDAAMSGVQAATHASSDEMDALGDAALEAGQRTVYSATESAAAIENLSRAGISTADVLGGALDGSLDLAAAGQLAVADAAEIAASAMTQFQLKGSDVAHVADLLAAGAGKAQGGVSDLGQALNQSGLVASQMGLSIEETVGSLTAFASAGLIGSDAGTSFRAMLLRLANPTKESAELMDSLGLSFYDAQGDFIGMEAVAGQLEDRLGSLTQEQRNAALAQIFGQDAIRSASILYEQGAVGVRDWTDAVDEQGYAAETAALRLDNLKGDVEALGGAFETLMINMGAGADGPLRDGVQQLTGLVEWLGDLDPAAQSAILGVMGLAGAVGLAGGAILLTIPKVAELKVAMSTLGITAAGANAAIASIGGPALIAIGAVTLAVGALIQESQRATASAEEWTAAFNAGVDAAGMFRMASEGWGTDWLPDGKTWDGREFVSNLDNVGSYLDLMVAKADNAWAALDPANIELDNSGFTTTINQITSAIADIDDLAGMQGAFGELVSGLQLTREQAEQLLYVSDDLQAAFLRQADAAGVVVANADGTIDMARLTAFAYGEIAAASDDAASGVASVGGEMQTAAEQALELLEAQQAIVDAFFAAQSAMSSYEQTVDDIASAMRDGLNPAVTDGGAAFDLTQQSGRDAAAMLAELVTNAQAASQAMDENGDSAESVAAYQARARDQIAAAARQMGLSEEAAREYADRLLAIPNRVATSVTATTAAAQETINRFINANNGRTVSIVVNTTGTAPPSLISRPGVPMGYADGGRIPGWSPGRDDRFGYVPGIGIIGLGGGEFIMPTLQTDRFLPILEAMRKGTFVGYADGGRVAPTLYQPSYSPVINVAAPASAAAPVPAIGQVVLNSQGGGFSDGIHQLAHLMTHRERGGRSA